MVLPFLLNYWLIPFNSGVITQIFNPIAQLAIPTGIPTKKAKAEMEARPVIVEITISKWSI